MDAIEFTKPQWYTLQETSLTNLTIMVALIGIAGYAMWSLMVVRLALAGAL